MKLASSAMLRRVALVRTDLSDELSASFIRATRIGELGKTLAATSNRRTQRNIPEDAILPCFHSLQQSGILLHRGCSISVIHLHHIK
jgi:hypothetical protein